MRGWRVMRAFEDYGQTSHPHLIHSYWFLFAESVREPEPDDLSNFEFPTFKRFQAVRL